MRGEKPLLDYDISKLKLFSDRSAASMETQHLGSFHVHFAKFLV